MVSDLTWRKKLYKTVKYTAILLSLIIAAFGVLMTWSVISISSNPGLYSYTLEDYSPIYYVSFGPVNYLAAPFSVLASADITVYNDTTTFATATNMIYWVPFSFGNYINVTIDLSAIWPLPAGVINISFTFRGEVTIGPYFKWLGFQVSGSSGFP